MKKLVFMLTFISVFLAASFLIAQNDSLFLKPAKYINSDNPKIIEKAVQLTKGCKTESEKVKNLFEFVRDTYSHSVYDSFLASDILDSGGNSCRQRSILLAALCRAVGIPARLHWQKVKLINYNYGDGRIADMDFIHGITGIKYNGKWYLYESVGNSAKWHVWVQKDEENKVEFKENQDCLFHNTDKVKILNLPVYFSDHYDVFPLLWEKFANDEMGFILEAGK